MRTLYHVSEQSLFFIHQAAAKQHRPSTEHELSQSQDSPSKQASVIKDYSPEGITEPTSSEESLREIPPTPPQPPAGIDISTPERHVKILIDGADTLSAQPGPSGAAFEDDEEELVPSPQKKKRRKIRTGEGMNTENEECELVEIVTQGHVANNGQDNVDSAIPRKKKKKKKPKSPTLDSLPPVTVRPGRRPLPPLQLED